jgi:hypothetical protein
MNPPRLLNRHALKTRETKAFLTSADGEDFSASCCGRFIYREIVPGTDWMVSLMGRTTDMDAVA